MMKSREPTTDPAPLLLVKAIGSSKSLVRDVCLLMFRGVSLAVVPLLAFRVDQTSKVRTKAT